MASMIVFVCAVMLGQTSGQPLKQFTKFEDLPSLVPKGMIADPNYWPKAGDMALLAAFGVWPGEGHVKEGEPLPAMVFHSLEDIRLNRRLFAPMAKDPTNEDLSKLHRSLLPAGTEVRVLSLDFTDFVSRGEKVRFAAGRIEITKGIHKGAKGYANLEDLSRFIPAPLKTGMSERRRLELQATARNRAAAKARSRAAFERTSVNPIDPLGSSDTSSSLCGASTKDGSPCQRRVAGGGYCYQHR